MTTNPSQPQSFVTATQLVRDFPVVRRMAEQGPVQITSHGRTEAVVLSPEEFEALSTKQGADTERLEWKLSLTLDAIETHVLILDEELNIRRANRLVSEAFSMPAAEMIGKHISLLVAHPTDQFVIQRLQEVLRSGQPEVIVVPSSHRPDRTIRFNMRPWPKGVALFADDITEREQVRDRRIADEAIDCSLDALGGVGIAHVQSNGTIISSSLGLGHMVGSPADTLAGARLQSLFDPRSRLIVSKALEETSSETRCYAVDYLRSGVTIISAVVSITPYWTAEHHACAAIALHDPKYKAPDCKSQDEAA